MSIMHVQYYSAVLHKIWQEEKMLRVQKKDLKLMPMNEKNYKGNYIT